MTSESFTIDENQAEFFQIRSGHSRQFQSIRAQNLRMKGALSMAKRKERNLSLDHDRISNGLKAKCELVEDQGVELAHLRAEIGKTKEMLRAKDEDIGASEKEIFDLKQASQLLEKYKFVFDYQIRELKQEVGPSEQEICAMKEQSGDMDQQLKFLSGVNENLGALMEELCAKQERIQNAVYRQRRQIRDSESLLRGMRNGLYACTQHIQDPPKLREQLLAVFNAYAKTEGKLQEPDTQREFARQCNYLQSSIDATRAKQKETAVLHDRESKTARKLNSELIQEIYALRERRKQMGKLQKQYELLNSVNYQLQK